MKAAALLILTMLFAGSAPEPAVPYFSNVRDVRTQDASKQNYITVDEEQWMHSSDSLSDLRIYGAQGNEVPYQMQTQSASAASTQVAARMLQLGTTAGSTTFVLDVSAVSEYNRIALEMETRNFVAHATVEGMDDIHAKTATGLGTYTLYDFTDERLGRNFELRLPDSRFRFLRIALSSEISTRDVKGASISFWEEKSAGWSNIHAQPRIEREGKTTVIRWETSPKVPLDRVVFEVDGVNYSRTMWLEDAKAFRIASGTLSRVKLQRKGRSVESENLELHVGGAHSGSYKLVIENGDDPPLAIRRVQPQFVARRIYFDPHGESALKLYYGDDRLSAPVYDYSKLFVEQPDAVAAALGDGAHNSAYTGRPDERPWSDRHPSVVWIALVVAVAALGALALRGMKPAGS